MLNKVVSSLFKNIYERLRFLFFRFIFRIKAKINNGQLKLKVGNYLFTYSSDSNDQQIMYLMNWEQYFRKEEDLIKNYIRSEDVVVDVGANLGFYTILLSSLVGTEGKIFSFEPSRKTFLQLEENIKINNLSNVVLENYGCGNVEGVFSLKKDAKFSGMDQIVLDDISNSTVEAIKVITLDKYFNRTKVPVNIIKIDTEGYESKVLLGAIEIIKRYHPVLVVELSNLYLKESLEAVRVIKELNYIIEYNGISIESAPAGTNYVCSFRS